MSCPSSTRASGPGKELCCPARRYPKSTMRYLLWIAAAGLIIGSAVHGIGVRPARPSALPAGGKRVRTARPVPPRAGVRRNIYLATGVGRLSPAVRGIPERVYVPNSLDRTLSVIDPHTYTVVARYRVGRVPHHVTPSWDLAHLYVDDTGSGVLTELDPRSGKPVAAIAVPDPYNLYFTPDGGEAIVVAEGRHRLDFRNPHTWGLIRSVPIPWAGVDHLDFSADGRMLLASTEFDGVVVAVDTRSGQLIGSIPVGGRPVDVRLAPDASVFYVANQERDGVSIIDPGTMAEIRFLPTGRGAHGLQVSRDARRLYVSNRLAGSISLIDLETNQVETTWVVGGSPDMMQLSPDGRELWVSNRFHGTVSIIDTSTGRLLHSIRVGAGPHGLAYFPQPGRFSLGHNGVYR